MSDRGVRRLKNIVYKDKSAKNELIRTSLLYADF